jgi:signal transduction histidine kinase
MGRYLLAVAVIAADTALRAAHPDDLPGWGAPVYAVVASLIVGLRFRSPLAAFAATLLFAAVTGGGHLLLIWAAFQAGRAVVSRTDAVLLTGAALGGMAAQYAARPTDSRAVFDIALTYLVFVALPLLVGRYLAQHERLVSALDQRNRQLRFKRELLGEQERLRERLRIARDMHDSLGHRLSLVSVQAAALEVSVLPEPHRQALGQLARTARDAMDELHVLVRALREEGPPDSAAPGWTAIGTVVTDFRTAGVAVTLNRRGSPQALSAAAGTAAYRLVEEGLTNAVKHAPGQPVAVSLVWEPDTLLLTVTNPVPPGSDCRPGTGHGLAGLAERVEHAGGFLDHRHTDAEFRLIAMLPTAAGEVDGRGSDAAAGEDAPEVAATGRTRTFAVGLAAAALMFVVLPVGILVGVR